VVDLLNRFDSPLFLHPIHHQFDDVDGETGRRIEHGPLFQVGAITEHGGEPFRTGCHQVITDDHHCGAGRADILLGPSIYQGELFHFNLTAHDIRRHVRHHGDISGIRKFMPLHTADGLIGSDMHVSGPGGKLQLPGNIRKTGIFRRTGDMDISKQFRFLDGLLCPCTRIHVIRGSPLQEIHGDHTELGAGTTLEKEHGVAVRHLQQ